MYHDPRTISLTFGSEYHEQIQLLEAVLRDRKAKKRDFRGLWIQQINAGVREHGIGYGEFISGLKDENIQLNRKMLADLAQNEPYSFKALVDVVKRMRGYPVDPPKT